MNKVFLSGDVYHINSNKVSINQNNFYKVIIKNLKPFKNVDGIYDYRFITLFFPEVFKPLLIEGKKIFITGRVETASEQTIIIVDNFEFGGCE